MITVNDVLAALDEFAPISTKMDFDNVGLLVGSGDAPAKRVLVALDITLDVINEAISFGAGVIVSHHPVIFSEPSVKSIITPVEMTVRKLTRANIAAICMHTNLDVAKGGVNDALSSVLRLSNVLPLCEDGLGRFGEITPMAIFDFLIYVKHALHTDGLRYVNCGDKVSRVAVCGGAGGDLIYEAAEKDCDALITADVKHSQFLDAKTLGVSIIDAGHFDTENVVCPVLAKVITDRFPDLQVKISKLSHRPERYFS